MTAEVIIALTLFGEARGETRLGKEAVASVIWNRAGGERERLADVCLAPRQFSCWNGGTPGARTPLGAAYDECLGIARAMLAGTFAPTLEATHYHAVTIPPPDWAGGMVSLGRIGGHQFYQEMER